MMNFKISALSISHISCEEIVLKKYLHIEAGQCLEEKHLWDSLACEVNQPHFFMKYYFYLKVIYRVTVVTFFGNS